MPLENLSKKELEVYAAALSSALSGKLKGKFEDRFLDGLIQWDTDTRVHEGRLPRWYNRNRIESAIRDLTDETQIPKSGELIISLENGLALNYGSFDFQVEGDTLIFHVSPPQRPLFWQIIDWLDEMPMPDIRLPLYKVLPVGATSLCFRWGTWMGWLADNAKPLDVTARLEGYSQISNGEMKRMNIEASANVAWLLEMLYENHDLAINRLDKVSGYLPLSAAKKVGYGKFGEIARCLLAVFMLSNRDIQLRGNPILFRQMGNLIANTVYRNNSPLENIHAGEGIGYRILGYRRLSKKQSDELFVFVASQMMPLLYSPFFWELKESELRTMHNGVFAEFLDDGDRITSVGEFSPFYPRDWSLDHSSSDFRVMF